MVVYCDRAGSSDSGTGTWQGGSVSFPTLHDALQAIEAEGDNVMVDHVMLMTAEGEMLLRQEDVKRLIAIGKRGSGH